DYLVKILKYVRLRMKNVQRISSYAKALDILRKSDEELTQLAEAGLDIVYMGLESGSSKILRFMKKGTNAESMIKAGKRILAAGIKLSLYILLGLGGKEFSDLHAKETAKVLTEINPTLGLGGKEFSDLHAKETAKVLTEINPTIFRFRTLNILPSTPLWKEWKQGDFELLSPVDCIKEERDIIAQLGENVTSQVFNDHVSNYVGLESSNIKEDRDIFLTYLDSLINNPRIQSLPRKNLDRM
ncbi:MAG: radical SAM protein, partial [Promethearchaeota archaeon]